MPAASPNPYQDPRTELGMLGRSLGWEWRSGPGEGANGHRPCISWMPVTLFVHFLVELSKPNYEVYFNAELVLRCGKG